MFSKKRPPIEARTVVVCGACGKESKREFAAGDVVFAGSECPSCGKAAMIEKVFGEEAEV